MPQRLTNLVLLFLVAALVASGLLGWLLPEWKAVPLYGLHRALGTGLLLLLVWKQLIVRASLGRRLRRHPRDRSVIVGLLSGVALIATLCLGLAWTLNLVSYDSFLGYSPLNLHVFFGLAVLPLLLPHVLRRWERRPAANDLVTRRSALRLIGLSAGTLISWRLLEHVAGAWAADGSRRISGSKHAGSFSGNDFPVTMWLFDTVPPLDPSTWRLQLRGNLTTPGSMTLEQLLSHPARQVAAVLDCTGGWWSEQIWTGVSVTDLLTAVGVAPSAREVKVVSATGHQWSFLVEDLKNSVLCTHVGGQVLTPGHGYPVRLVVPGRRGFQWVKWVSRLEVA
jgi:hypothetical protein